MSGGRDMFIAAVIILSLAITYSVLYFGHFIVP